MSHKKPLLIYIAGYGRSGSTLLSMLLNTLSKVYNLGELDNLFTVEEETLTDFWKAKIRIVATESETIRKSEIRYSGIKWFFKKRNGFKLFKQFWNPVMQSITDELNPVALIDASKSTNATYLRPFYYKMADYDVKVIHLVRDLSGVVQSFTKGKNSSNSEELKKPKAGGSYRAIFNWTMTNILTALFYRRKFDKEEYYFLSYEKLMNDYNGEMDKLLTFLDIEASSNLFQKEILLEKDISFSGNRVRLSKTVSIKPYPKRKIGGFVGILITLATWFTGIFVSRNNNKI